jgi:hypothetical protein
VIKINGVQMPTPSDYQVGIQDLSKADRNARGTMIIERIRGGVRKLEMQWKYLTKAELQQLLNAVAPVFFEVEYPDPIDGTMRTGTFYVGDRKAGAIDYRNGEIRWKDCQFNLVER